jgi:F-type H+-transporting ATPase subunit a
VPQQDGLIQLAQGDHGTPEAPATSHTVTHAAAGHGEHQYKLGDIPSPGLLFSNALLVALAIIAFGWRATRKLEAIPKGWQNLGEFIVETFMNFTRGIIGPGGEKYAPLVGTLFMFIYIGNLWGQIPYLHSPTANLSTTLALGLIVFFYVQYVGIRQQGIVGYLKHFWGPIPAAGIILFPIEVISEIVKPFTLAMRLFGNIFGEDTVIIVLATLGVGMLPALPILPLHFPVLLLSLLTTFVQALVFTLLTCIYISLQSHHDEAHGEPSHAAEAHHAA